MTIPTQKQAYAPSLGTAKIPSFIFSDRDPSASNVNHDLYTGWVNTITKALWYLEGLVPGNGSMLAQWRAVGPIVVAATSPGNTDYHYPIGQTWINTANSTYWGLVNITGTTATWEELSGGGTSGILSLTGNSGGAVESDGSRNIDLIGDDGITVVGNPGSNTLTISATGTQVNIQVFETSGTYTPTSAMLYCIVEMVGAGGGGSSVTDQLGAGGGGGEYARGVFNATDIGLSQAVTIGIGGAGGSGGSSGSVGTDTEFGILLIAQGGDGGTTPSSNNYGVGGLGGFGGLGGDFRAHGGPGGSPFSTGATSGYGGFGGTSFFAPATISTVQPPFGSGNGADGGGFGGGGAGGAFNGSGGLGGDGLGGLVIITEFF